MTAKQFLEENAQPNPYTNEEIIELMEGYAASKQEKTADSDEDLFCPFCKEKGFDKIGLKNHMNMYCHIYPIIFDPKY